MRSFLIVICFFVLSQAEDPLLGIVRGVKCRGCIADSVLLLVDDPIDGREIEVAVKDSLYNRILTPLPGRKLRAKPEGCFYWMEAVKVAPLSKKAPKVAHLEKGRKNAKPKEQQPILAVSTQHSTPLRESACIPYVSRSLGVQ